MLIWTLAPLTFTQVLYVMEYKLKESNNSNLANVLSSQPARWIDRTWSVASKTNYVWSITQAQQDITCSSKRKMTLDIDVSLYMNLKSSLTSVSHICEHVCVFINIWMNLVIKYANALHNFLCKWAHYNPQLLIDPLQLSFSLSYCQSHSYIIGMFE